MPGFMGALGVTARTRDHLVSEFCAVWPDAEVIREGSALLMGHAFTGKAVRRTGDILLGVDGEWSLYTESKQESVHRLDADFLDYDSNAVGNLAVLDLKEQTAYLAADETGSFPAYYLEHDGGFVFGSHLRPLARLTGANANHIAILEFLLDGYTTGQKTMFEGISHLLPGQSIRARAGMAAEIKERSRAWVGKNQHRNDEAAEEAWSRLTAALRRSVPTQAGALMMSAGWDSRTLLAGLTEDGISPFCYSHGDTQGRELRLVERLCREVDQPYRIEPIDGRVIDVPALQRGFQRTENVVFPHWHRAGEILAGQQHECVAAGVLGEILGGHYGPAMMTGSVGKIRSVAGMLLGLGDAQEAPIEPRSFLHRRGVITQWYLRTDYQRSIPDPASHINADIDCAVERLEARGLDSPLAAVEAYITEHRGKQYINQQLLSCRASTNVALPFAGGELFTYSTRIPLGSKIHNSLNRRMLARYAPDLLEYPMAATLVPASAPILVQEISRVVRKVWEAGSSTLYEKTRGRIPRPRLGWVNFEFLKNGSLHDIVDDLHADFWEYPALRERIESLRRSNSVDAMHPLYDQLGKIYTVDLMVR